MYAVYTYSWKLWNGLSKFGKKFTLLRQILRLYAVEMLHTPAHRVVKPFDLKRNTNQGNEGNAFLCHSLLDRKGDFFGHRQHWFSARVAAAEFHILFWPFTPRLPGFALAIARRNTCTRVVLVVQWR